MYYVIYIYRCMIMIHDYEKYNYVLYIHITMLIKQEARKKDFVFSTVPWHNHVSVICQSQSFVAAIHPTDILDATCSGQVYVDTYRTYVKHHDRFVKCKYSKFKESKEAAPNATRFPMRKKTFRWPLFLNPP